MIVRRATARLSSLLDESGRAQRIALIALAGLLAIAMIASGLGSSIDGQLKGWRDAIRSRSATGQLVFVEIDARSLAAIDEWPWPRSTYVRALRALDRAGAATIGFDVDFAARSTPREDRAFADALAATRTPVILAAFRQASSESGDGVVENLPLPELRQHALLGAVNIFADPDGLVRSYPYGFRIGSTPRPSISALLAGANGRIDTSFPIDGAIDPDSVPRISFIDLIEGRIAPSRLRGKTVLIGASAIELGDRYPLPRHGVLPGALIQLLAAETLLQGTVSTNLGALIPLFLMLVGLSFALRQGSRRNLAMAGLAAALLVLPLGLEWSGLGTLSVAPALVALAAVAAAAAALRSFNALRIARTIDSDTGLPNRRALAETIGAADCSAAVVALRLQNFADVLSVMGRARGAELMARIAERLAPITGAAIHLVEENALAWVVRGQGEEAFHSIEAADAMLRPGFDVAGRLLDLQASFGIADAPDAAPADAIGRALAAADAASARNARWERYSDALNDRIEWQLSLAAEVNHAMATGQIWVAYQPKLDLASDRITAAEALVRWTHPTRGAISPAEFIPVLEASGKIFELTLYVLERALRDLRTWREIGRPVGVAVNVSALLPGDGKFADAVERLIADHGVPPGDLTLEVTETVSLIDGDAAVAALERLAAIGIKLSIDDYGTGQSTLSYLKRLPAREIKIDQSFVKALDTSRSDQAMVRSTIQLAHELGYSVVAEGVETQPILELLRGFGCDVAQGWLIGRPKKAMELTTLLDLRPVSAAA